MTSLIMIVLTAALINNVVLNQFLGLCSFLGVSKQTKTAACLGVAVIFVITIASGVANLLYSAVLKPLDIEYLQTIVFILVIAALVQVVELFLRKSAPALHKALGIYIPLIVVNCIILGRAEAFASKNPPVLSIFDGLGMGLGFTMALFLISAVREIIGNGTLFGAALFGSAYSPAIMVVLPPGGFLTLGLILGIINLIRSKRRNAE